MNNDILQHCPHPVYVDGKCTVCGAEQSTTRIDLTTKRVMCGIHLEPLRANWPEGYAKFVTSALDIVLSDALFAASVRGKVDAVNGALDLQPLCCRLLPEQLLEVMQKCTPMVYADCKVCREYVQCFSLHRKIYPKKVKRSHMCLRCFYRSIKNAH